MANKNKILEFEENIEKSAENLSGAFDLFGLAMDEMKRSFSSIFWVKAKQNEYFITPEMEKFEKTWLKNYEDETVS